uniref:E3 ubiquitin-protein ligase MARCHF6 n=1 Tax=Tetraodon nigroviridis TaxID=99883 RepID=H3CLH0_TETNG
CCTSRPKMDTAEEADICRVCRSEGTQDRPLYHPCVCTGSIKFIHQECLLQWLKHSRKEYCELCQHRFAFTPIYSPDMPSRLPVQDIFTGLLTSVGTAVRYWFHYTLVAFSWLGLVPLTACRIYKCLFAGSVSSLLTLPLDLLSTQNLLADCLQGCFVVACTLGAFISLVWLREQIVHGGAPQWLEQNPPPLVPHGPAPADQVPAGNDGQAPAVGPPDRPPDHLAPADPPEAENLGDEADLDDDDDVRVQDGNNGEDLNWNALEWERAAEELTWERMLGLDGSLVFLEHVFWVVSLNALFILVFAFCPYHIGHFWVAGLGLGDSMKASHFEGLITTILGYVLLAGALILCHALASLVSFQRSRHLLGVCYIVVKVSLLVVMEIGLFPLICGWWLDICSLEMFDATLKDRQQSLASSPGTTMFLHWLVGMVYVFYLASFILLLREVLRPGVLWFLRNLNDPDFNPVQEMIHLAVYRHLRRFILSVVVFGSIVLLMLWLPIRAIKVLFPTFLPYNVMLYSDAPVSELSLELLLLQVVLPALLEQGHTRQWLKKLVHAWTFTAGYVLDLHSYLLGEHEDHHNQINNNLAGRHNNRFPGVGEGLHAAHQALLRQAGPVGVRPYHRPVHFPLKIALLLTFMCVSLLLASLLCLTLPVCAGRWLMSLWMGPVLVHELYTAASGLYVCWLAIRAATVVLSWMPQGPSAIMLKVHEWMLTLLKALVLALVLAGLVPLLLGLLFELVIVAPLRPLDQTPLFSPWQDWALGVLHAKIIAAITLMGPQWWLKAVIEQVYANGLRNMDLRVIVQGLAAPVVCILLLALSIPYTISKGITPLLGVQPEMQTLVERRIYPFLLMLLTLLVVLTFQIRQFRRLYEHIKNDKYLVGQRLVNYERRAGRTTAASPFSSSS